MRNSITVGVFVALASVVLYFPIASGQDTGRESGKEGKKAGKSKKEGGDGYSYRPTPDWRGTLREHSQGNIYNETVTVTFSFNEERDGTIKGVGRVTVESEPQRWCDGGTVTRTLITTDQSEVPISGKRVGDEFLLEPPTNYVLKFHVKTDCPPPHKSGTTEATRRLGMSKFFYEQKVQAHDGAKDSYQDKAGDIAVSGSIEIHQAERQSNESPP